MANGEWEWDVVYVRERNKIRKRDLSDVSKSIVVFYTYSEPRGAPGNYEYTGSLVELFKRLGKDGFHPVSVASTVLLDVFNEECITTEKIWLFEHPKTKS